jgi:hypothetical protein
MGHRSFSVLLCVTLLVACAGSRTGNPNAPEYESSSRFAPDPTGGRPTSHEGGLGGTRQHPAGYRIGGDFAALFGDYIVAIAPQRGLLVIDVADPKTPQLAAELPLDGAVYQLHADATGVTLAVHERLQLDEDGIPREPVASEAYRLVRVDLTDPTHPRRAFDVDLDGIFWQLIAHGEHYFVIADLIESDDEAICSFGEGLLIPEQEGPPIQAMEVTHYELTSNGFEERDTVELPTEIGVALSAGDTYLVMEGAQPDNSLLRWVDFADGALTQGGPLAVPGRPVSADREGDTLAVLFERDDNTVVLTTYSFDAPGVARERGSVTLPARDTSAVSLLASGGAIVDGDGALLIDLSDLDAPRLASQLPTEVARLLEGPTGLVGLGNSDGLPSMDSSVNGTLVVSLWDASALAMPVRIGRVATESAYPNDDLGQERWALAARHNLLLVPLSWRAGTGAAEEIAPPITSGLGAFDVDAMSLSLHSEQATRTVVARPLADDATVFNATSEGLEALPLVEGASEREPVSAFFSFQTPEPPIDRIEVGGAVVELRERATDGVFYVDVTPRGSGEPTTLDLDHYGQELVAVGDRVVAIGLPLQADECEYFTGLGIDPQEFPGELGPNNDGMDPSWPCASHRARGVSVISLDGTPRIAGSAKITSAMDVEVIDGIRVRAQWQGYLVLEDGRLAFLSQRTEECQSYADCERLGVPAYESFGSPGCNPDTQDCADLPKVQTFVSGYRHTLGVYTLEDVDTDAPDLALGAVLDGRFEVGAYEDGPLDIGPRMLSTRGGIALARQEDVYNAEGNSIANAQGDPIVRFFLDRVVLDDDGSLEALPPVNTPGRPVALDGDAVYCLEPRYDGDEIAVQLHRAALREAGAFIDASVDLGTGFLGTVTQGANLWVLRGIGDPCQPDAHAALFAVLLATEGELDMGKALDLPGGFWSFPADASTGQDTLLLRGGPHPTGWLIVDASDPSNPEVARYTTFAPE